MAYGHAYHVISPISPLFSHADPWWRHQMETFSALLAFCAGNSPVTGALIFSLIGAWTNGWVNNRDAGDSRRHRAHNDVIVITIKASNTCIINPDIDRIRLSSPWNIQSSLVGLLDSPQRQWCQKIIPVEYHYHMVRCPYNTVQYGIILHTML